MPPPASSGLVAGLKVRCSRAGEGPSGGLGQTFHRAKGEGSSNKART